MHATLLKATTLAPFCYHSLMVQSGTATLPEIIGDRALAFALASSLGMMAARVALPAKDYRRHLAAMPFRTAVLLTTEPRLLPPRLCRLNLDAEAGLKEKVDSVAKRGNLKSYFMVQEVPPQQIFYGAVFGLDPFQETGQRELVIRVGLHRNGMVKLEPPNAKERPATVRLNAATAALFGRELPVERYLLHGLQLTPRLPLADAAAEVATWN